MVGIADVIGWAIILLIVVVLYFMTYSYDDVVKYVDNKREVVYYGFAGFGLLLALVLNQRVPAKLDLTPVGLSMGDAK